jgi:uncharacterized membrane protein
VVTPLAETGGEAGWVLQPTRSMSWPQARRFIVAVTVVSLAIGAVFAAHGLPLVMPFSGLEALAVGIAFYLVLRDGQRREVVRITGDRLVIERGRRRIEELIELNRFWVRVELRASRYRYHPTHLVLRAQGRAIEVGRFLTDGERELLSRALINALHKNR